MVSVERIPDVTFHRPGTKSRARHRRGRATENDDRATAFTARTRPKRRTDRYGRKITVGRRRPGFSARRPRRGDYADRPVSPALLRRRDGLARSRAYGENGPRASDTDGPDPRRRTRRHADTRETCTPVAPISAETPTSDGHVKMIRADHRPVSNDKSVSGLPDC